MLLPHLDVRKFGPEEVIVFNCSGRGDKDLDTYIDYFKVIMKRIDKKFQEDKKLLSIYFSAGYPSLEDTVPILRNLQAAGVDMVEIGLPFSDPLSRWSYHSRKFDSGLTQWYDNRKIIYPTRRYSESTLIFL